MKVLIAVLALAGAASIAAPASARVCLHIRALKGPHSDNGRTLIFKMRDGTTRVNHLQGVCNDLKFNGFAWTIHGPGQVCEGEQNLRVLQSGQICVLGKFDPPVMSREKHAQR